MRRRRVIAGLLLSLVAPLAAEAQQTGKVWRIGLLGLGARDSDMTGPDPRNRFVNAIVRGLRELGYVYGQHFVTEPREGVGAERYPELAADLIRQHVDVIVTGETAAALAAKRATSTIPIVFAGVSDPIGVGLVSSLAKPDGNVTGMAFGHGDGFSGKWLDLIREMVPHVRTVAVLMNQSNPANARAVGQMEPVAWTLALRLLPSEVRGLDQLAPAFKAMTAGKAAALVVLPGTTTNLHIATITDLAAKAHLPAIYPFQEHAVAGGLMSYGPSLFEPYRRAATYVDKILKGAKPEDLPIEQPTILDLVINLKTAKALGLTIPPSLLLRADQVIE